MALVYEKYSPKQRFMAKDKCRYIDLGKLIKKIV